MTMIQQHERRSNRDRRELDVGVPYGLSERRWRPERRTPLVIETDFDDIIEVLPIVGRGQPEAPAGTTPGSSGKRRRTDSVR